MHTTERARLEPLFAAMAALALGGCGGGGEDGIAVVAAPPPLFGTATPVSAPPLGALPPTPGGTATGLSEPTLQLRLDGADAVLLAKRMADAGDRAAGAVAALALGTLDAGASGVPAPTPCPDAGTLATMSSGATGVLTYLYSGCQVGLHTFNGTSSVRSRTENGTRVGYTVTFNELQVSAVDAPAQISGELHCEPAAAGGGNPACVASYANFLWGRNTRLGSNGVEGTHQCSCDNGTWNVTFDDFTQTSGLAYVTATNGHAVVTRTGEKDFRAVLVVGDASQAYDVVLK